ncbi:hypothetical protein [Arthrobacter sp. NPDC057013]|uniref:hypothetical protein n=1 Tax=Arthrobacter sp. NPDC057013 TaxID=3345999 RepID=UPI00362A20AD
MIGACHGERDQASEEGISHNEAEFTRDEDAVRGTELLTEVVRRLVRGELEAAGINDD